MKAEWIARVTGGRVIAQGASALGAVIDTRIMQPGELFIALPGSRVDGHDYLLAAATAGAAGLLIADDRVSGLELPPGVFVVAVPDPRPALALLGAAWRRNFQIPAAAITGSCGKSTTREMLRAMLSSCGIATASPASFNNDLGLPLTLLRMREESAFLIAELGTNSPGEIAALARLTAPDLGIITGVGPVHLEGLGSEAGVAAEKGDLAESLPADGVLVLDRDGQWYEQLRRRAVCPVITVSLQPGKADICPEQISYQGRGAVVTIAGQQVKLPLPGLHNVKNFLLAMAGARGMGVDSTDALAGFPNFSGVTGRLEQVRLDCGALALNDTYNSNYQSATAALEVLANWPCSGRRIAVLGEMHELGRDAALWHQRLGEMLGRINLDLVLFIGGKLTDSTIHGAQQVGFPVDRIVRRDGNEAAISFLRDKLTASDVLLLKASRGVGLEQIVSHLVAEVGGD